MESINDVINNFVVIEWQKCPKCKHKSITEIHYHPYIQKVVWRRDTQNEN